MLPTLQSIPRLRAATRGIAAACALCVAFAGVSVRAEPSASDKETARALMKDGEAKREKGDLQGALQAYKAAHAIMGVPTTGLELGRVQADLGLLVEARDTLLGVTRIPVRPGESPAFAAARSEAQKLADELEPKIPSLTIALENVPEGAKPQVTVDGHPILEATIGVPRKHNPGKHVVAVTTAGGEKKTEVELAEGESRELTIDLSDVGTAKPVETKPVETPEEPEPTPAPPPPPSQTSPLVWVGFGSAAAFGAVGAVTGILAFSKASSAKDGCVDNRCPPATHDDIDGSKTFGTVSTVAFALAGAGALVGVIGLFSSGAPKEPAPAAAKGPSVRVVFGPTGLGLAGTF